MIQFFYIVDKQNSANKTVKPAESIPANNHVSNRRKIRHPRDMSRKIIDLMLQFMESKSLMQCLWIRTKTRGRKQFNILMEADKFLHYLFFSHVQLVAGSD